MSKWIEPGMCLASNAQRLSAMISLKSSPRSSFALQLLAADRPDRLGPEGGVLVGLVGWRLGHDAIAHVSAGAAASRAARGARLTAVLPDGRAAYDGRATQAENWFERIGVAEPDDSGSFAATGEALFDARYLEVLPIWNGGYRLYYEARLADESHELRAETVAASRGGRTRAA